MWPGPCAIAFCPLYHLILSAASLPPVWFFLATSTVCGRDQTHTPAAARATVVTVPDPEPTAPRENSFAALLLTHQMFIEHQLCVGLASVLGTQQWIDRADVASSHGASGPEGHRHWSLHHTFMPIRQLRGCSGRGHRGYQGTRLRPRAQARLP